MGFDHGIPLLVVTPPEVWDHRAVSLLDEGAPFVLLVRLLISEGAPEQGEPRLPLGDLSGALDFAQGKRHHHAPTTRVNVLPVAPPFPLGLVCVGIRGNGAREDCESQ